MSDTFTNLDLKQYGRDSCLYLLKSVREVSSSKLKMRPREGTLTLSFQQNFTMDIAKLQHVSFSWSTGHSDLFIKGGYETSHVLFSFFFLTPF